MTAKIVQARISVDDRPAALLSIENTGTGTDERPTYRVTLDCYRERRQIVIAEITAYERQDRTRLNLLRDAFAAILEAETLEAGAEATT